MENNLDFWIYTLSCTEMQEKDGKLMFGAVAVCDDFDLLVA